jgi:hypothetical protein
MKSSTSTVGPDVHKSTISVAIAEDGRGGDVRDYGVVENRADILIKLVERLGKRGQLLHFCYEAGPCPATRSPTIRSIWKRGCRDTSRRSTIRTAPRSNWPTRCSSSNRRRTTHSCSRHRLLAATQADLVQSEAEFYRQSTLGKSDVASQSKVDEARAKRDNDKAKILSDQAGVTIAAINLGYTRVNAQFDGEVTAHLVSVGNGVTKLASIVQLDPIYASFTVSEQQVLRIKAALAARNVKPGDIKDTPVEVGLMTEDGYPHVGALDYVALMSRRGTDGRRPRARRLWLRTLQRSSVASDHGKPFGSELLYPLPCRCCGLFIAALPQI